MHVNRNDVAKYAGVSSATVSRVINGSALVSPETKARVLEAMRALNYRPNEIARSLVQKRTDLIGIVVPQMADGLSDSVVNGVESVVTQRGFSLLISLTRQEPEREEKILERLMGLRVSGIIALPVANPKAAEYYRSLQERGFPLVMFIRHPEDLRVNAAVSDDYKGGTMATEHLLGLGHRRIVYVASQRFVTSLHVKQRIAGYADALQRAGLPHRVIRFGGDVKERELVALFQGDSPPTAIVCSSDNVAFGVHRALRQMGLSVPADVSLTGYDNVRISESMTPQLTTVDIAAEKLGEAAASILLRQIEHAERGRAPAEFEREVLPPQLIVRESTAPPPARR